MNEDQIRQGRELQNKIMSYGVVQSLIDGVVFFGSNKVVLSLAKSGTKVGMVDTLVFTIGDIVIRQTPWIGPTSGSIALLSRPQWGMNAAIAGTFLVVNTIVQAVMGRDVGTAIEKSLIKAAVGFGGNATVDFFLRSAYN
jgi:hypothetical protein